MNLRLLAYRLGVGPWIEALANWNLTRQTGRTKRWHILMPTIRPANLTDARPLALVAETTFRETFAAANTAEDMALHCRESYGEAIQAAELADPARATLLCTDRDQIVGFAQLRWQGAPACVKARAPGEIQRLYVVNEWQGRGAAKLLMEACLAEMIRRRTDVAWLGVWERNPRAIAFYRKFGFAEAGEHRFLLGKDQQRDLVMVRAMEGLDSSA